MIHPDNERAQVTIALRAADTNRLKDRKLKWVLGKLHAPKLILEAVQSSRVLAGNWSLPRLLMTYQIYRRAAKANTSSLSR